MIERSRASIYAALVGNGASRMGVTDLRVGGNFVQTCAVVADIIYDAQGSILELRNASLLNSATGADLDALGADVLPSGLGRVGATRASGGALTFTRPAAPAGPALVVVPEGTAVSRSVDGVRYVTAADATFVAAGSVASGAVSAVCQRTGTVGNCDAAAINIMAPTISGVTGCTNIAAVTNGTDSLTDEAYREQIRLYVRGLSRATQSALVWHALQVEDGTYGRVRHAKVIYDPAGPGLAQLVIDDGNGTAGSLELKAETLLESASGGEKVLWTSRRPLWTPATLKRNAIIESANYVRPWGQVQLSPAAAVAADKFTISYYFYNGLCELVQNRINGDLTRILSEPDVPGAGCEVMVVPAGKYGMADVTVEAWLILETTTSISDIQDRMKRAVVQYVNSLGIGATLYRGRIYEVLLGFDEVISVSKLILGGADQDIVPGESKVLRTSDASVTLV